MAMDPMRGVAHFGDDEQGSTYPETSVHRLIQGVDRLEKALEVMSGRVAGVVQEEQSVPMTDEPKVASERRPESEVSSAIRYATARIDGVSGRLHSIADRIDL